MQMVLSRILTLFATSAPPSLEVNSKKFHYRCWVWQACIHVGQLWFQAIFSILNAKNIYILGIFIHQKWVNAMDYVITSKSFNKFPKFQPVYLFIIPCGSWILSCTLTLGIKSLLNVIFNMKISSFFFFLTTLWKIIWIIVLLFHNSFLCFLIIITVPVEFIHMKTHTCQCQTPTSNSEPLNSQKIETPWS